LVASSLPTPFTADELVAQLVRERERSLVIRDRRFTRLLGARVSQRVVNEPTRADERVRYGYVQLLGSVAYLRGRVAEPEFRKWDTNLIAPARS